MGFFPQRAHAFLNQPDVRERREGCPQYAAFARSLA